MAVVPSLVPASALTRTALPVAFSPWGIAVANGRLTNAELSRQFGVTEQWIVDRTGIDARAVGGTTSTLAIEAARRAVELCPTPLAEIDLVLLATTSPDRQVPATASAVAAALGLRCGAVDVNAACAGFVYGLLMAAGMVGNTARSVLLIAADAMRTITDDGDRDTSILFGDGAAATVLSEDPSGVQIVATDMGCDGNLGEILYAEHGRSMVMAGREVFKNAVIAASMSAEQTLDRAEVRADDLALFVPHQANIRIVEAIRTRVGIPSDRTAVALADTGNTSSASIPLALAAHTHRIPPGGLVLLTGFGAGMTWASVLLRWPETPL